MDRRQFISGSALGALLLGTTEGLRSQNAESSGVVEGGRFMGDATAGPPSLGTFDARSRHQPADLTLIQGTPIRAFGDLCVYSVCPDFQPENEIQIGNKNEWRKVAPKQSWEISSNYMGCSLPRLPGTESRDYQYYLPIHLIDGDPKTCWISRPMEEASIEPQWIRIDLPQESDVAEVVMVARQDRFPVRGFAVDDWAEHYGFKEPEDRYLDPFPKELVVETSKDGWKWETVYQTQDLPHKAVPGEEIHLPFPATRAKAIRVTGQNFGQLIGGILGTFFAHCWCLSELRVTDTDGTNLAPVSRGSMVSVSSTNYGYQGRRQEMNDLWACLYDLGLKWLRIGLWDSCLQWHYVEQEKGIYVIDPVADQAVTQAAENGMTIIMGLEYGNWIYADPPRSNLENLVEPIPYDSPPAPMTPQSIEAYKNFVHFMVDHFRGRVKYWEIWNEPLTETSRYGFGHGAEGMERYLKVFNIVAPVIRATDPAAKLLSGVRHPGIIPHVEGFDAYRLYSVLLDKPQYEHMYQQSRDALIAQGFKGSFFSEENQWNVTPLFESGVTEIGQAKNLARTMLPHAAHQVAGFWNEGWDPMLIAGPTMFMNDVGIITASVFSQPAFQLRARPAYYMFRNLCTVTDGAEPKDFPIVCDPSELDTYGFALPDGSRLVALWIRGKPVDSHPGERVNLRLPGAKAASVVGIDTLNGREKAVDFKQSPDGIVVSDLLVRDYPLILRVT